MGNLLIRYSMPILMTLGGLVLTAVIGCTAVHPSVQPVSFQRTQLHMGTLVTVTALASETHIAQRAVQAGFGEIKRLEQLLSTWRSDSELSHVNAEAGQQPVWVSQETMDLVARALDLSRLTAGGFNIMLGPAIDAWSVTERQRVPDLEELRKLKPLVDWSAILMNRAAGTIYLPHRGMRIDIGGIGKGYAADRAVEAMKRAGAQGGIVALSGDIKAFGIFEGRVGFPVGIRHPRQEGTLIGIIDLQDEAISTAGDYERFFEQDGVRYHHILDPETLEPARRCQSVTVLAKEGTIADGLDTGIFVLGPELGMALVEQLPDVEAIIIDDAGRMTVSSGLRHRLRAP